MADFFRILILEDNRFDVQLTLRELRKSSLHYVSKEVENKEDYIAGSPITYAKNLQGHLLIVHGTGDDNVHYANAEMMLNELIKYNKIFQFMPYPNRTHSQPLVYARERGAGPKSHR